MTIRFTNKERFFKKLVSVVPEAEKELTDANRKSAQAFVDMAKRLAPVKSGMLRDSVSMDPGERPTSFVVQAGGEATTKPVRKGADASYDYALGVEFGTTDTRARPFFWPSFRANKKPAKARATRALRKAIKAKGFGTN